MQTVKFVYSGSEKRKFTVMGRDQVIVSGDDNSTQFIFLFPDSYQSYSKEIVWDGFYIKDSFDEITVARYPIVNDTFYVPQEVTLPNSGREISFQVVMYKPQDEEDESSLEITESSQLYPVYISKSATGEQLDVALDSVSQLVQRAYVTSAYDVDSETDRPIVKFSSLSGREYVLPLNMPYLDENGIVAEQFLPPGQVVEVLTFSDIAEMMEDTSAKPPDFAIITEGTQGSEIDYAGNIFIKTDETTEYDGWVLIHSQYVVDNFDNKVDKIPGHSLVQDSEIQKLSTVEQGAQQNVIEQVQLNGVQLPINSKVVAVTADTVATEGSSNLITSGGQYIIQQQVTANAQAIASIQDQISLEPSIVAVSDQNGNLVSSSITTTELDCLDGVTSQIQTQLDDKTSYLKAIEEWDQNISYLLNSTVIYNGAIYISKQDDNIGYVPDEETAYWSVIQGGGSHSDTVQRTIGDGVTTNFTIVHNMRSKDVFVTIREAKSGYEYIGAQVQAITDNSVSITFTQAPAVNSVRVIISGGPGQSSEGYFSYEYEQETPSTTWVFENPLGRNCLVQTFDYNGQLVEGTVTQTQFGGIYTVSIGFNEALQGIAILI